MCRINPRIDLVFKKMFSAPENKDMLIDFINAIVSEKDQVADLEIKNPYSVQNFINDKLSIMDIKAVSQSGKHYNIEMQITDQEYYDKRALYYWSKLYNGQLFSGVNYDNLKKAICINIVSFTCLEEPDYHNVFKILNVESKQELIDDLEIHFIELSKYDDRLSTLLDRWVNFLKKADYYNRKNFPIELKSIPTIEKAFEVLENFSMTEYERDSYEARLKWLLDEEAAIITAENKGMKKGLAKGKAEGKAEVAKKMLEKGIDLKTVLELTGLNSEDLK